MSEIQCCFRRYEKKYLLTTAQYEAMREGMAPYVRPDEYGRYSLGNVYYDTDDYRLIRSSLEKPVYKEKLRVRSYGVPGEHDRVFVELKKKYEGVVYKRRIVLEAGEAARFLSGAEERGDQISREIAYFLRFYRPVPKAYIAYDREAYAGRVDDALRITFDTGIRCRGDELDLRAGDRGAALLPPDTVLMEIKIPGAAPLWLAQLLSGNGIFPTSFSKYGSCYQQFVLGGKAAGLTVKEVLSCA